MAQSGAGALHVAKQGVEATENIGGGGWVRFALPILRATGYGLGARGDQVRDWIMNANAHSPARRHPCGSANRDRWP